MLALLFCALLGSAAPGPDALETALRAQMAEANAPGAAYAVVRDGEVVAASGLGLRDKAGTEAVTADTLFLIGSVTKTLTTAAILRAAEAKTLDLDAPAGRFLSGLDPAIAALTPRQLLSQTSGLGDLPGGAGVSEEEALLAFARSLGPKQLVAPPGATFSYSNPGFALAGALLEAAGKEPYAEAMRRLLFVPLGMTRTTLRAAEAAKQPRAVAHDAKGEPIAGYDLDTRLGPAGYVWSTASDLALFVRDWLAAFDGRERVLSRSAVRLMAEKAADFPPTFDGTGYGHGLFIDERHEPRVLHHPGLNTGFSAQIVLVPERGLGLVLLMNRDRVVFTKTVEAALNALAGLPPVVPATLGNGEPVSEEEARPLLGRYRNRWPLELLWAEGGLRLRFGDAVREVRGLGSDRYLVRGPGGPAQELRVGRSASGPHYLRQFLWAFGREFVPAGESPP